MKYKKYPSYKDSGVEWLGEIPENWNLIKNRHIFKHKHKVLNDKEDMTVLSLTTTGVKVKKNLSFGKSTESYIGHQMVYPGNLVFTPRDFDQTPILSDVSDYKGCISNLYMVLNTNHRAYNHFVNYYWWGLKYKVNYFKNFSYGIRFSYNFDQFKEIPFLQPSIREQQQITKFLDNATQKIDTLIVKQEKLIELLKEKRQAVISHAVTNGINPDAKMKDSGVEWLGDVPEHWNVPKIKHFALTDSGGTPTSTNRKEYYDNGIYPWIRTTDLNNSVLFSTPIKITQKAIEDTACNLVKEGSVLIGMYGGAGTIGKHSLLKFTATINQAVCSITPNKNVSPEYLHYFIQFYRPYWMIGAMGTRKDPNIGQDTINNRNVPIPTLREQLEIVIYLNDKTNKIDTLIEKSKQSIKLLKEKRTALISAAVTGKIDVRDTCA